MEFKQAEDGSWRIFADWVDITDKLHHPSITALVPTVAAKKVVREVANEIQRQLGQKTNTVMAGRDIGSEIFPEAKLKFFISATPEIRAQRRFHQLRGDGLEITEEQVLKEINERDAKDQQREHSPLRKPIGAIEIDTSEMTLEETVEKMMEFYRANS